jgi:hypothetical protein
MRLRSSVLSANVVPRRSFSAGRSPSPQPSCLLRERAVRAAKAGIPSVTATVLACNLGPGRYRFRVIACNNDGVWNNAGASLDFSILPAYYQINWFRALCAAAFLALVWAVYRFRVHQL